MKRIVETALIKRSRVNGTNLDVMAQFKSRKPTIEKGKKLGAQWLVWSHPYWLAIFEWKTDPDNPTNIPWQTISANRKTTGPRRSTTTRRPSMAKGTKSGLNLAQTWAEIFIENEGRAKPQTDEQLIARMEKEFPAAAGKSTTNRPRMYRSCYNAGTYFFETDGASGGKSRPVSFQYDTKGNKLEPGTRGRPKNSKPKEKKVAAKRKPKTGKSKVTKKAPVTAGGKRRVVRKKKVNA